MLLFRSLTVGLLGACLWTVVQLTVAAPSTPAAVAIADEPMAEPPASPPPPSVTVVDIASGVAATQVVELLRLGADERVTAVDDVEVESELAAGAAIASRSQHARQFVDLTVSNYGTSRRVLVLMH